MNTDFKVGMIAFEVIRTIVAINPEISRVFFGTYIPAKYFPPDDDKTFRRNSLLSDPIPMGRETLLKITFEEFSYMLSQDAPENQHLGFLSQVELRGEDMGHIPLMDFSSKAGDCLETIEKFLKDLHQPGVVLSSGRSFHYYRSHPITKCNYLTFMGYCILAKDPEHGYIADRRYIGHMLVNGFSLLRISASNVHPHTPRVAAII